jgi:hypothetical protein
MRGTYWKYGVLGFCIAVLCAGHFVSSYCLPSVYNPFIPTSDTHTPASVLVRICSLPLRICLSLILVQYFSKKRYWLSYSGAETPFATGWVLLAIYYCLDMTLAYPFFQNGIGYGLLASMAAGWIAMVYVSKLRPMAFAISFAGLCFFVLTAQQQTSSNNAFTLFGLQGLAIGLALTIKDESRKARCFDFVVITPALGYIAPVAEKLMLNPVGWLSGQSLIGYGAIYGYTLPQGIAIMGSIGLLLFQLSMALVLIKPKVAFGLYPPAVLFHLVSGMVLGFGTALNPWILSLWGAVALLLATNRAKSTF